MIGYARWIGIILLAGVAASLAGCAGGLPIDRLTDARDQVGDEVARVGTAVTARAVRNICQFTTVRDLVEGRVLTAEAWKHLCDRELPSEIFGPRSE